MTTKEIYQKYKEVFILVMETAGEETGNKVYKDVEKILNKNSFKKVINQAAEQDVPLPVFICICIVTLLGEIHGPDKLSEMDMEESYKLADFMFQNYLKKPTRKFTSTYGLPVINSLDTYFKFTRIKDGDN